MSNKQVKLNVDSILKQAGLMAINVIPPLRVSRLSKFESTNNFSVSLTSREYFGSSPSIYNKNLTPRKNVGSLSSRESFLNFNSGNTGSSGQSLTSREELSTTRKSFSSNRRNNSTSLDLRTEFVDDIVFNPLYQKNEEGKGIASKKRIRLNLINLKSKMT